MGMVETMKKIAAQSGEAATPAAFMIGTVTKITPALQVMVDNRFYIDEPALVVMKGFKKDEVYPTHTHGIEAHTHDIGAFTTEMSEGSPHNHQVTKKTTVANTKALSTDPKVEKYFGLKVGEKVVLLRNYGGQEFLVLGRV